MVEYASIVPLLICVSPTMSWPVTVVYESVRGSSTIPKHDTKQSRKVCLSKQSERRQTSLCATKMVTSLMFVQDMCDLLALIIRVIND
jgi:hypothetical protein